MLHSILVFLAPSRPAYPNSSNCQNGRTIHFENATDPVLFDFEIGIAGRKLYDLQTTFMHLENILCVPQPLITSDYFIIFSSFQESNILYSLYK